MSSWKMEFLKFGYRTDRLTFTEHLISTERELSVLDLTISVVVSRGRVDELFCVTDRQPHFLLSCALPHNLA